MKFETKISGVAVTDFKIETIFKDQYVWLSQVMSKVHKQKTMDFILDKFRFYKGEAEKEGDWCAIFDYDTIYKISIMENYPQYENELIEHFGEKWMNHYLRFNH